MVVFRRNFSSYYGNIDASSLVGSFVPSQAPWHSCGLLTTHRLGKDFERIRVQAQWDHTANGQAEEKVKSRVHYIGKPNDNCGGQECGPCIIFETPGFGLFYAALSRL